jgi:glycosyltransferase involved in cell wall biosynthesis
VKIGAILPHVAIFGGVRRYIELGNAFVSRGHTFTIHTPEGVPPDWLPFRGAVRRLAELSQTGYDIVITGSPELVGHLDDASARVRVFYLQLEGIPDERRIIRSGKYLILVNSSGLARRVKRRYGIEPIDGIGGFNPELFHPATVEKQEGVLRVLCYGRFSRPRKGTRFVIEAVKWMHRRGYPVQLCLFDSAVGGVADPRIGFDPGIPFRFYLNLPQTQMAAMYAAADVFVSAEHRAGWCNTAAEAAACGLPLVCTRSGTEDFAVHGESALVVPFRAVYFIRRALVRLARDRNLCRMLGEGAVQRIADFTWDRVCARMERRFEEMLVV